MISSSISFVSSANSMIFKIADFLDGREEARLQCTCIRMNTLFPKIPIQIASRALYKIIIKINREIINLKQVQEVLTSRKEAWAVKPLGIVSESIRVREGDILRVTRFIKGEDTHYGDLMWTEVGRLAHYLKELEAKEKIIHLFGGEHHFNRLPPADPCFQVHIEGNFRYGNMSATFPPPVVRQVPPAISRGVEQNRNYIVLYGFRTAILTDGTRGASEQKCMVIFQQYVGLNSAWSCWGALTPGNYVITQRGKIQHPPSYQLLKDLIQKRVVLDTERHMHRALGVNFTSYDVALV